MTMRSGGSRLRSLVSCLGLASLAVLLFACKPSGSGDAKTGELSGTYKADGAGGSMTLVFKGRKVQLTMEESGGQPDTKEGDYMVNGKEITIQVPGGYPITLVRDGETLSGTVVGQILHFEKK